MSDLGRWFKLWCAAVYDPDLDNLPVAGFGRWAKLGAIIKEQGRSGKITFTAPAKAVCAAMQVGSFQELFECFSNLPNVLVSSETTPCVSFSVEFRNWLKYQENLSTDRVRRFRDKERKVKRSKKRGEEKRGEETREEEKKEIPISLGVQGADTKSTDTPDDLRAIWNEVGATTRRNRLPGFVLCKDLSPSRKAKAASRLKEAELEWHRQVITRLGQSTFACGGSPPTKDHPKPFRASFDWYIDNDTNCLKISEGKYDN